MSKKGKKVWERVYNERTSYLMLLPNIIMFAVFTVYPILWALRYMLFDYRGYGEAKFVGICCSTIAATARRSLLEWTILCVFLRGTLCFGILW